MQRRHLLPRALAACLCGLLPGAGVLAGAEADSLSVADAWMREPAPGRNIAALYMQLRNAGRKVVVIAGVRVPPAGSASIHESVEVDGMMRMRAVPELEIPPGAAVSLAPGGYHVMVFDLAREWQAGDRLPFCLLLGDGGEVCGEAVVKGLGDQ